MKPATSLCRSRTSTVTQRRTSNAPATPTAVIPPTIRTLQNSAAASDIVSLCRGLGDSARGIEGRSTERAYIPERQTPRWWRAEILSRTWFTAKRAPAEASAPSIHEPALYFFSKHLLAAASHIPATFSQSILFVACSQRLAASPSLPTAASGGVTSGRKSCQSSLFSSSCLGTSTGAMFCNRRGDVAKAWPATTQAANVSTIPALMDE